MAFQYDNKDANLAYDKERGLVRIKDQSAKDRYNANEFVARLRQNVDFMSASENNSIILLSCLSLDVCLLYCLILIHL